MGGFPEQNELANQSGIQFLLADLGLALSFMDLADLSLNKTTVRRNHRNARAAYETVVLLLQKLRLDEGQRQAIDAKLALLRTRLQTADISFD